MGLLSKLFGKGKRQPYVEAGTALTIKLCRSLSLPDWNDGLPNYTPEEQAAIDRSLSLFQEMANREMGGEARFHPDVLPEIQRNLIGRALAEFAAAHSIFSDEIPENWRDFVSTYLKAWAARLDPTTLLELGEFLAKVGRNNEAREAFRVVLLLPTYAKTLWGEEQPELISAILDRAKEGLQIEI